MQHDEHAYYHERALELSCFDRIQLELASLLGWNYELFLLVSLHSTVLNLLLGACRVLVQN